MCVCVREVKCLPLMYSQISSAHSQGHVFSDGCVVYCTCEREHPDGLVNWPAAALRVALAGR